MRKHLNDGLHKALYVFYGVIITLALLGLYQTYTRMGALQIAWQHPEVVQALEITTKTQVSKK